MAIYMSSESITWTTFLEGDAGCIVDVLCAREYEHISDSLFHLCEEKGFVILDSNCTAAKLFADQLSKPASSKTHTSSFHDNGDCNEVSLTSLLLQLRSLDDTSSSAVVQTLADNILRCLAKEKEESRRQYSDLEEYAQGLRSECDSHSTRNTSLRSRLLELDTALTTANEMIMKLKSERAAWQDSLAERELRISSLEGELRDMDKKAQLPMETLQRVHSATPRSPSVDNTLEMVNSESQENMSPAPTTQHGRPVPPESPLDDSLLVLLPSELDEAGRAISPRLIDGQDNEALIEQLHKHRATNARLHRRLTYVTSRLETKDSQIQRMTSRIEEVCVERDSFKQAMMTVLNNNAVKSEDAAPAGAASATAWPSLPVDSAALKHVMNSFLTPASPQPHTTKTGAVAPAVNLENSPGDRSQLAVVEKQLLDSEMRASTAEEQLNRLESRAEKEMTELTAELEATEVRIDDLKKQLEASRKETEETRRNASRTERRATACENKVVKLNERIVALQKELAETSQRVVDPGAVAALESRIAELMGDSKYWQNKAQSLSKEVNKAVMAQTTITKLQEELTVLRRKNEELIVERNTYRDAMQEAMTTRIDVEAASANSSTAGSKTPSKTPIKNAIAQNSPAWFKNFI